MLKSDSKCGVPRYAQPGAEDAGADAPKEDNSQEISIVSPELKLARLFVAGRSCGQVCPTYGLQCSLRVRGSRHCSRQAKAPARFRRRIIAKPPRANNDSVAGSGR
jgi:hypothetical protein